MSLTFTQEQLEITQTVPFTVNVRQKIEIYKRSNRRIS